MLDVVIVGAGMSGISCARHIRANDGMQRRIKVLEATSGAGQDMGLKTPCALAPALRCVVLVVCFTVPLQRSTCAGGRARTLVQNGSTIDLGATWVHGGPGNASWLHF